MTSPPDQAKRQQTLKQSRTVVTASLSPKVQHVIFCSPSFTNLAEEIVTCDSSAKDFVALGKIQWKKFEDGFPNLMINNVENVRGTIKPSWYHLLLIWLYRTRCNILSRFSQPWWDVCSIVRSATYFPTPPFPLHLLTVFIANSHFEPSPIFC